MDLFSVRGYRDVSVEEVVERCGLSVGTFYKYFPSKEAFYEQLLSFIEREGIAMVDRAVERLFSPMNQLKAVYRFVVLGVQKYPILRGILSNDPRYRYPGMEAAGGAVGNLRRHVERVLAEVIRDGSRRGVFRPGLYRNAPALVVALMDTVIANVESADIETLTRDVLVLIQRGLRRALRLRRRDERLDRRSEVDTDVADLFD